MKETLTMTREELQDLIARGIREYSTKNKRVEREDKVPEIPQNTLKRIRSVLGRNPNRAIITFSGKCFRVYTQETFEIKQKQGMRVYKHRWPIVEDADPSEELAVA